MSDPAKNTEVEDVLSSIRRLVSEDKRPLQAQIYEPANDRLVLTPALRVAEAPDDQDDFDAADMASDEITNTDELQDDAAAQIDLSDDTTRSDPAHDYEADPYNFADDDDKDGGADAALDLSELESEIDAEDDLDAAVPAQNDANPDRVSVAKTAALSAKIEALETAIGNISDTWEPDTLGSDDYSGTEAPAMAWENEVDRDAKGAPLGGDIEQADINASSIADDDDVQAAVSQEATDDAKATSVSEPTATVDTDDETSRADGFAFSAYGADDQTIDELVLRDLVSDMVRAELQGALGERITRNVRKLVRREIHRALTAQELE